MNKFWSIMALCVLALVTSVQAGEYRHRISVFSGVFDQAQETDVTFGAEYEYRPFKYVGVGLGYERTDGALHTQGVNLLFGTVTVHPLWGFRVSGSLGEAAVGHYWDGTDSTFRRYSVAYDFQINSLVVGPVWNKDRINQDDVQTYGLQVGLCF